MDRVPDRRGLEDNSKIIFVSPGKQKQNICIAFLVLSWVAAAALA